MAFDQLTYCASPRDTECCLGAMKEKLYHIGIRSKVSGSTLADANEKRDWRIYADFVRILIHEARKLSVDDDFGLQLRIISIFSLTNELVASIVFRKNSFI
jgi:hypothetical protein